MGFGRLSALGVFCSTLSAVGPLVDLPAFGQAQFQPLGDVTGGLFNSFASDVSADGSVVVGQGSTSCTIRWESGDVTYNDVIGNRGVIWTAAGGMTVLEPFPVDETSECPASAVVSVSPDGSLAVGSSLVDANRRKAVSWSPGSTDLDFLQPGDTQSSANDLSTDGAVIVGYSGAPGVPKVIRAAGGNAAVLFEGTPHAVTPDGSVMVGQSGTQAFRWTAAGGRELLGNLPGGGSAVALDVSDDGEVIVGYDNTPFPEAFRWTRATGIVSLGHFPGGFSSRANGVSGDGKVVVGSGTDAGKNVAWIWTEASGLVRLQELLGCDLDLSGWNLGSANAVSAHGTVIVGSGTNPAGNPEAFRAVLSGPPAKRMDVCEDNITILSPPPDTLVFPSTTVTVRWQSRNIDTVNVYFTADPDLNVPALTAIKMYVPADSGRVTWTVPDTLTPIARIYIEDASDTDNVYKLSSPFRIKDYALTRVTADQRYERFTPAKHGWSFRQNEANLFPPAWRARFDFQYNGLLGSDPVPLYPGPPPGHPSYLIDYLGTLALSPINGRPEFFPDWPSMARAYRFSDVYLQITDNWVFPRPSMTQAWWDSHLGAFTYDLAPAKIGMAVSALMAFGNPGRFGAKYPSVGVRDRLFDPGDDLDSRPGIRQAINELNAHFGDYAWALQLRAMIAAGEDTPRSVLAALKRMLIDEDRSYDSFLALQSEEGRRLIAMVPYRLERLFGGRYALHVYDPESPGVEPNVVLIDSTANVWSYPHTGATAVRSIYLMNRIEDYFGFALPGLPEISTPSKRRASHEVFGTAVFGLSAVGGADLIISGAGGRAGMEGGKTFFSIEGGFPILATAHESVSAGRYILPVAPYQVTLGALNGHRSALAVDMDSLIYRYDRDGVGADQTDVLWASVDGVVAAPAGGSASKSTAGTSRFTLTSIARLADSRERLLSVEGLSVDGLDSVGVRLEGRSRFHLKNSGETRSASVRVLEVGEGALDAARYQTFDLVAGATHTLVPVWSNLSAPMAVWVDADGDGVSEDTLYVEARQAGALFGIAVTPATVTVRAGETVQFSAEGFDGLNQPVDFSPVWSASGGAIDAGGLFAAGTETGSFEVRARDEDGLVEGVATVQILPAVSVEEAGALPAQVDLRPGYPNPFNPTATMGYGLPRSEAVRLVVFDALGRAVATLVEGVQPAGWHEVRFEASGLPSGMYFFRLEVGDQVRVRAMALER